MNKLKKTTPLKARRTIGWQVYISFLVVFLILLGLSFLSFRNANDLVFDTKAVDSTYTMMQQLQGFTSLLRDTEMANNAYILLGKERYLTIYQRDAREVNDQMQKFEKIWPSLGLNSGEESLQSLIDKKIEDMNQAAWERDKRDLNHALQIFLTGRWQKLSEAIQKNIDAIQEQQKQLLKDQTGKKTQSVHKTILSIATSVSLGLLLFFIAALVIRRDLVRRMLYETQLEEARSLAVSASDFKSQFLANMSHEIRTPMNGIMGMATVLLETDLDEKQTKYAGIIKRSCEALLRIINDILDFSKVEAGKLEISTEAFDFPDLLAELKELFTNSSKQKGIGLTFNVDPKIPENLTGDCGRIRQILNNLIGNAVKFTEKGSVTVTATMKAAGKTACKVLVEVADTGIGIPEAHQKSIFGAFVQGETSTSKRYGGTGLGLNISKRLLELMGGQIGFESKEGAGSTFWIELQLEKKTSGKVKKENEVESNPNNLISLHGRRLKALVAEDDFASAEVITRYLERMGIDADVAPNGKEAYKKYTTNRYDVACLDFNMPLLNGLEALEKMRAWEKSKKTHPTPIFIVTAELRKGTSKNVKALRGNGLIHKPLKFDEFKDVIERSIAENLVDDDERQLKSKAKKSRDAHSINLLVADDSDVNQDLMKIFLGPEGFNLDFAFDGKAALELFKQKKYDLVLMDVQMPILDGLEATKLIRVWEKDQGRISTPILAFTAGVTDNEIRDCKESGCNGYISKPIEKKKFLAAIKGQLKRMAEKTA